MTLVVLLKDDKEGLLRSASMLILMFQVLLLPSTSRLGGAAGRGAELEVFERAAMASTTPTAVTNSAIMGANLPNFTRENVH